MNWLHRLLDWRQRERTPVLIPTPDPHALERARMHWHLGDWEALVQIDLDLLQAHPERAKLALLKGAALQQLDKPEAAARLIQLALEWGCGRALAAQILIAGVHNRLARAALMLDENTRADAHFRAAVASGTPGLDSSLLAQARARHEAARISDEAASLALPALPEAEQQPPKAV